MTDRRKEWPDFDATSDRSSGGAPRKEGDGDSVLRELQELGRQLATTVRSAWESESRQEMQQEMTEGVRSLRDQLTEVVDTLRTDPRAQAVKEQVGKVAETTRATDVLEDVRTGLAGGLRELNDQLRRLAERLESQSQSTGMDRPAGTAASGTGANSGQVLTPSAPLVSPAATGSGPAAGAHSGQAESERPTLPILPEGPENPS